MRTLSVREVADALGMTPRGVIQRLNRGQLKGTKKLNQSGIQEWQIYANREILQAVESKKGPDGGQVSQQTLDFAPDGEDTVDAEGITIEEEDDGGPSNWRDIELARLEMLAEKLVKPLTERLEFQAAELREKALQLEEKDRQLRLLPDLEKRAEEERKAAELRALEVEALKKQIEAIAAEKEQIEQGKVLAEEAANEAQSKLQTTESLKAEIQGQLQALRSEQAEEERKAAEVRALELDELKQQIEAIAAEKQLMEQGKLLAEEAANEAQSKLQSTEALKIEIQGELQGLRSELEKVKQPWWKKLFSGSATELG